MKPIDALATTGVAFATDGLSVRGNGLLDRITAEKEVCEEAMTRAEKQLNPHSLTRTSHQVSTRGRRGAVASSSGRGGVLCGTLSTSN